MKTKRTKVNGILGVVLLAVSLVGCGGDSPSGPDDQQGGSRLDGPMKATIDGTQWASAAEFTTGFYNPVTKTYLIQGTSPGINARAVLITLGSVDGPGTYSLPNAFPFRYANLATGSQVWETGPGTTGTVVVTVATPPRFAGTFSFTAGPAGSNQATNTINVTNGSFDVIVTTTE